MDWNRALRLAELDAAGPFDESDEVNHDPDSLTGEEDESGFDDMPLDAGWEDEGEDDDDDQDDEDC